MRWALVSPTGCTPEAIALWWFDSMRMHRLQHKRTETMMKNMTRAADGSLVINDGEWNVAARQGNDGGNWIVASVRHQQTADMERYVWPYEGARLAPLDRQPTDSEMESVYSRCVSGQIPDPHPTQAVRPLPLGVPIDALPELMLHVDRCPRAWEVHGVTRDVYAGWLERRKEERTQVSASA